MSKALAVDRAIISEIFSSLQGEGTHAGEKHLFVRFQGCNMRCRYCDERDKPGAEMTLAQVLLEAERLERAEGPHRFVSLTGGEPLQSVAFLKRLLPELRSLNHGIYLETNGVLWSALADVLDFCDVIAMDMKPVSVTRDRCVDEDHRRFLMLAKAKEVFVKIVVSREIDFSEFDREIGIISEIAPEIPVVLQPMSPLWGDENAVGLEDLMTVLRARALRRIPDVRMIARLHKLLNIR